MVTEKQGVECVGRGVPGVHQGCCGPVGKDRVRVKRGFSSW